MPIDPVICRKCGAGVAMRINRNGFWQRAVLGRFGFYPWKCGACGTVFFFRRRGHRPRSTDSSPDAGHATRTSPRT